MDIKLNYTDSADTGATEPLILLHGNGESLEYFHAQIKYFSKHWRVIAVDTRGHGKSPRGTAPFSLEQFAEDLKCFLDNLNLQRVNLLGFSDGGNIALLFSLKYPDRVIRLILNGANLDPRGLKKSVLIGIFINFIISKLFRKTKNTELLSLMLTQPHILPEKLNSLNMPSLVIVGELDMIREEHSKLIAESLGNGQLCVLRGSHFIANENPSAFNKEVENFLMST